MSYEPPPYGSEPPPPPGGNSPYGAPPPGGYGAPPPGGGYGAPPPSSPYGAPPGYGGGQSPSSSVLAIVSLVTGILGVLCCGCFVLSAAALVTGIMGKKEIAESGGVKTGAGMAQAGFILGIVGLALGVVYWILNLALGFGYNY